MMVVPSTSWKSIWINKVGGAEAPSFGIVRKTYVWELRLVFRVVSKAVRLVSPSAGLDAVII